MSKIRYLLDENVNPILRFSLLASDANLTVWQVGILGAPEYGTLDPEILIWCEDNGFILVTHNRKSMPVHLAEHLAKGRRANGILTLSENMSVGETVDELVLIASASELEEYQNLILYLPIS
ncbi:MAG: DUF5615 family PIN-like protein [Pyrinomonadaceae bacterium]